VIPELSRNYPGNGKKWKIEVVGRAWLELRMLKLERQAAGCWWSLELHSAES
jgi:hypothetical protein